MSMDNKDLPAFPASADQHNSNEVGLTKREYFAAMAMQGSIASLNGVAFDKQLIEHLAKGSVAYADALLQELSKTPNP